MIGDVVPIIAIDAPQRDRRTDDIRGQVGRQALVACWDIPFLHVRHTPLAIARVTGINEPLALLGLQCLAQHGEQMPLPLLAQQGIGPIVEMHPLFGLLIPS
jgi:hypothetical protein